MTYQLRIHVVFRSLFYCVRFYTSWLFISDESSHNIQRGCADKRRQKHTDYLRQHLVEFVLYGSAKFLKGLVVPCIKFFLLFDKNSMNIPLPSPAVFSIKRPLLWFFESISEFCSFWSRRPMDTEIPLWLSFALWGIVVNRISPFATTESKKVSILKVSCSSWLLCQLTGPSVPASHTTHRIPVDHSWCHKRRLVKFTLVFVTINRYIVTLK